MPRRESTEGRRVLVLGRRKGLEAALRRRGVPFALWTDRAAGRSPDVPRLVAPWPATRDSVRTALDGFDAGGPITHCIAAVEAAVVAASHARRVLDARTAPHSVALRCHDKLHMKRRLRDAGVPVTDFVDLAAEDALRRAAALGSPVVIKDRRSSGSRGVEIVDALPENGEVVCKRGRMAERFVDGEEMSVESFVADGRVVWANPTRYWRPKYVNVVPAGHDARTREELFELNRSAIRALGIRFGMTHLELFRTADGPVVGEVALRPPGGYLMSCIERAYGFDPWEALVAIELGETPRLVDRASRPVAALVLHPGAGRVAAIEGLDAVRAHPAHVESRLRVAVGDPIGERVGVGQDVGHVLLRADDHAQLDAAIRFVERTLRFELDSVPPADGSITR